MTKNELMQTRFKVMSTYPNSKFKKGDILERIPNATNDWYNADKSLINADILLEEIEQYPHIFRKLNWWECRNVEDMPKKIQSKTQIVEPNWVQEEWDGFKYLRAYDTESAKFNISSSFRLESFVPFDDEPQ